MTVLHNLTTVCHEFNATERAMVPCGSLKDQRRLGSTRRQATRHVERDIFDPIKVTDSTNSPQGKPANTKKANAMTQPGERSTQPMIDQTEAARVLGLKNPRTLAAWRLRRVGPPYHKVGKRLVRYDMADLLAWASRMAS